MIHAGIALLVWAVASTAATTGIIYLHHRLFDRSQ